MGRDNFVPAKPGPRSPMPDILGAILNDNGKPEQVALTSIRLDGATQMRAAINDETVEEYASAMVNGWGSFPPAVVFYDGATYWLADGFHRVRSFMQAFPAWMALSIPCEVHAGTQRDAVLYAAQANAKHGLRRTNADKRRAVETLLRDEEWGKWSNQEIARRCAVDPKTVGTIRAQLTMEIPESTTRMGADGRVYNTSNIGKTIRVVGRPEPPNQPNYVSLEVVTALVRDIAHGHYTEDHEQANAAADMRHCSRMRSGGFWTLCVDRIEVPYKEVDLAAALSNVAQEWNMAQLEKQHAPRPVPPVVMNTPSTATVPLPPLEDVSHLLSQEAQLAGFTAWRRGDFSAGASNASGSHSFGGAGVTVERLIAWADEQLGIENRMRLVEQARENHAGVSAVTPAESALEAPRAVLNPAPAADPDEVIEHPLDCYEEDDNAQLERLAWPKRMRDLWELKDWFRRTVDDKLEEFGKLTGRYTMTLAAGRELKSLMAVLEAEMDALQEGADRLVQEGGDAVRQNESQ